MADYDDSKMSKVKLVDNSSLQAEGNVNIVFQISNGGKPIIKDVIYVPGMKCNLLSVIQWQNRLLILVYVFVRKCYGKQESPLNFISSNKGKGKRTEKTFSHQHFSKRFQKQRFKHS